MTSTGNGASSAGTGAALRGWGFPSETFPPLPQLTVDAPAHWEPVDAPDSVLALRATATSPTAFLTNLVVSVTRFSDQYTLAHAVSDLETRIVRLSDPQVVDSIDLDLGGHPAHLREVAFSHPQAGRLRQGHLVLVLDRGRVRDLVHATGSCADDAAPEAEDVRAALLTLRVVGA